MTSSDNADRLPLNANIAFIGGGNMARSLIGGLLGHGTPERQIRVSEPNAHARAGLERDFGIATGEDNAAAAARADIVVLAVKPQVMQDVCGGLRESVQMHAPLIVSIAAGIRSDQLERWLGGKVAIVRCMPNTPALIGAGATGLFANTSCSPAQRDTAQSILSAAGITVWIEDEAQMDVVTALSGSGPAYFFLLVEVLQRAAEAQGLAPAAAQLLATQTCLGAGRMLCEGNVDAAELRRRVTSPGGTTQAALESFAADHFETIVERAVEAAVRRGREMSRLIDGD